MQGLVARILTLEKIWNVEVIYITAAKIEVKVTRSRYLQSQYIKKHVARFDGCRPYS